MINTRDYQICSRCVMDTSDKFITFDEEGRCNHCVRFLDSVHRNAYVEGVSESRWEQILSNIRTKGRSSKYDCIVGISGDTILQKLLGYAGAFAIGASRVVGHEVSFRK